MSGGIEKSHLPAKKIFISAGEQSGDLHASTLIAEIKNNYKGDTGFHGLGGDMMKTEGTILLHHINELSTIGFTDVIKKYGYFRKVLKRSTGFVRQNAIDLIILVDYPGFNLRFAEKLRSFYNGKIVYYISPQLWAWHEKRISKIKKYIDKMLVVFPFETEFYSRHGIDSTYVGHPLVKRIRQFLNENPGEKKIYGGQKTLTILPGSRKDEIKNHLPVLIETASQLMKEFDISVNISKAPGTADEIFGHYGNELKNFRLMEGNIYRTVLNADVVLTKAGTSSLECALIGTPHALFYRTYLLNYYLLKPVVKIDRLGIANILSDEMIIKEFIQNDFTAENLLLEARRILTDENYREQMKEKLNLLWDRLGTEDASQNAARIISNYLSG